MENRTIVDEFLRPRYTCHDSGYSPGSGFGYGDGKGFGPGSGYGFGDYYDDGSGTGSGYDSYSYSGCGFGHGDAYGRGISDGSGHGDGDGYGIKQLNHETVWMVDEEPTLIDHVRGDFAKGRILNIDLTTTPCYIARVDGFFAHGATLHEAQCDALAKAEEGLPVEVKIERFKAAFPSLDTEATCKEFYDWHHRLTGSCTMGRDHFVKEHGLDMDAKYTVGYFLDITKDSYGGEIIKRLRTAYN